jgi:glycosyltransferase involved in cell wall biosynthesis
VNADIQGKVMEVIGNRKSIDVEIFFNNILVPNHSMPMERMKIRNQYAIPEDAKVLVTAGVLNRGKNIEVLLKSLPKIGIKNLFLFIIGDGSTKENTHHLGNLKEMTKELGLEKITIFTGWLQNEERWEDIPWCRPLYLIFPERRNAQCLVRSSWTRFALFGK